MSALLAPSAADSGPGVALRRAILSRDAERFPATNELFGQSTYTASRIATVDVMTSTEGVKRNQVKQKKKEEEEPTEEASGDETSKADPTKLSGGTQ